jgi:hypothetical protein
VIFTVEQTDTRNKDINKFSFAIEDRKTEGGEFIALPVPTYVNIKEKTELDDIMQQALTKPMRAGDLIDRIMEVANVKRTKAYEMKASAEQCGIIEQDTIHTFCYRYKGLNLQNEENMPF